MARIIQNTTLYVVLVQNVVLVFRLAKYLEALNMPDDLRELLDEYTDASDRADGDKDCQEYFQCPYSLKDAVKRNFSNSI